jgi:hypothetical protein
MTYPSDLEKIYYVKYSTYNDSEEEYMEDGNGKWEFDTLEEANHIYLKTVENKEHEWVALIQSLKIDEIEFDAIYPEAIYPDYIVMNECLCNTDNRE